MATKTTTKKQTEDKPVIGWKAVYCCTDCGERFEATGLFYKDGGQVFTYDGKALDIGALLAVGSERLELCADGTGADKVKLPLKTAHTHLEGFGVANLIYFNASYEIPKCGDDCDCGCQVKPEENNG